MTEIRVRSIANAAIGEAEVRPTNETGVRAVTHAFLPLDPCSRAGCFRGPQPDQIPEERVRTNQPGPSRGSHPHPGLLEQ